MLFHRTISVLPFEKVLDVVSEEGRVGACYHFVFIPRTGGEKRPIFAYPGEIAGSLTRTGWF